MISYLSGEVIIKKDSFIILDVQGVGYKVFISERTFDKIPDIGQNSKLFCHLHVRENMLDLYGFSSIEELELFEIIGDISGIGPKAALQIAAIGSLEDFRKAIAARDERFFAGVHGIGKKRVQTIILELTGKLEKFDGAQKPPSDEDQEVIDALVALGFPRAKAREALLQVPKNLKTAEERVRSALKAIRG
ncbi:Holliday junction branch migration protein RuvA [Patescibacteria group bacterium]|nr:Holliday junction branch migration protein RuvA [Patescibacteria group bacterium]